MPVTVKSNGTVQSVSRSGSTRLAVVRFPHDPPPPDVEEITFEVGTDDYADFRAALVGDNVKVDVTYDDSVTPASPTGVKLHK